MVRRIVKVPDEEIWLSSQQVQEWLNITQDWLYDQVQKRQIPHIKIGRLLRFNKAEIKKWIKEHRVEAN